LARGELSKETSGSWQPIQLHVLAEEVTAIVLEGRRLLRKAVEVELPQDH